MSAPFNAASARPEAIASFEPNLVLTRIAVIADAYYPEIIAGAAAYARSQGWDLDVAMIRNPGTLPKQEDWAGVLCIAIKDNTRAWLKEVRCPVVEMLNDRYPQYPRVVCDYPAIGRCGAEHLLGLGDISFAYCSAFPDVPEPRMIREAFCQVIQEHGREVVALELGLPLNPEYKTTSTRMDRIASLMKQLGKAPLPIAIMADDDRFAVDCALAARGLGLRIPEDVAILGVDNQELVLCSAPVEISSIDCHLHEVGWRSAELLGQMIYGSAAGSPEVPMLTTIPPKGVVIRRSTATFVCGHPGVTAAAMFVREHFRESITVEQVAAHARMSVRSLQTEYASHVGKGVKDDILQHRIDAAHALLERTNMKLDAVAVEAGLSNSKHLCRIFQQKHGMTPNDWRRKHGQKGIGEN